MQITFTGHHLDVTPALKEKVTEKFTRLSRHLDRLTLANVTFKLDKQDHVVEATLLVPGHTFHAHAGSSDMYAAIDLLVDKLDRQITKHKEKSTNHRGCCAHDLVEETE